LPLVSSFYQLHHALAYVANGCIPGQMELNPLESMVYSYQ